MLQFTVDDNQAVPVDGCMKCCCETMQLKPGTISKVGVNYASWVVPIGRLHCTPQFVLEPMQTCPTPAGSDLPPRPADKVAFDTLLNTELDDDLNSQVTDPEGRPMTFKGLLPYGPQHGKLVLASDGTFTYTPDQNYTGPDRFYASASDGVNAPVVFEVIIGIGVDFPSSDIASTPHVSIDSNGIQVDQRMAQISFPVKVSPAAQLCEVWRLSVVQNALDCDCICYNRVDCYDIRIVRC